MPAIPEGKHLFDFPDADGWHAIKYDEINSAKPGFYRQRVEIIKWRGDEENPGVGIKGVDIVATQGPAYQEITLLEIKDFREDEQGLKAKIMTGEIPVQIAHKVLHTWGALCLGARHEDGLLAPELRTVILRPPGQIRVVFFLAQSPIHSSPQEGNTKQRLYTRRTQRQDILAKLQRQLKPLGIKADLADVDDLPKNCGWTVVEVS